MSGRVKLLPNDSSFACFPLDVVMASTTMTKLVLHCDVVDVDTTPESPTCAMDMILHNQTADPRSTDVVLKFEWVITASLKKNRRLAL